MPLSVIDWFVTIHMLDPINVIEATVLEFQEMDFAICSNKEVFRTSRFFLIYEQKSTKRYTKISIS